MEGTTIVRPQKMIHTVQRRQMTGVTSDHLSKQGTPPLGKLTFQEGEGHIVLRVPSHQQWRWLLTVVAPGVFLLGLLTVNLQEEALKD